MTTGNLDATTIPARQPDARPPGGAHGALGLAGAVGVLAALWPARRAARMNVLRAVTGA